MWNFRYISATGGQLWHLFRSALQLHISATRRRLWHLFHSVLQLPLCVRRASVARLEAGCERTRFSLHVPSSATVPSVLSPPGCLFASDMHPASTS